MGSRGPLPSKRTRSATTAAGVRLRPLPEDADAIFRRLVRDVENLKPADAALLELMAYWMEIAKECRTQLAQPVIQVADSDGESGNLALTVTDTAHGNKDESRKNPLLIVLRTATEQIRALAAQLGASPMARARLPEVDDGQASFGEDFFRAAAAAMNAKNKADAIR